MAFSSGNSGGPMADINVTPLVDVMLVLLIIFLITVPVVLQTVPLTLPKVEFVANQNKPEDVNLSVRAVNGRCEVYWGLHPETADSLLQRATDTLETYVRSVGGAGNINEENIPEVHIRGDINTPYRCIGGAIFVDGKLFRGTRGAAGEAAFLQVPGVPAVRNPAQDNHGGFEDLAGEAVVRELAARVGINSASAPDAVAALIASDTQAAREVLTDIGGRYAIGLASILALLDPAEVILAGAVAAAGGQQLVDAVASELSAVAIATPPVSLGLVTDSPITRGAMILSLGHARDRVFNT